MIIPVYKPDEKYHRLIAMLAKQTVPVHRILVMNTEEKYYPQDVTAENLVVTHIGKEEFDHGGTRSAGVDLSDAEIVLFMTQDAVPADEHLVENILKGFSGENVAAVYGRQLPNMDCSIIERYTRSFNYPKESFVKSKADLERLGIKTYFCSNVCAAYRRDVYEKLGGFPTRTIFNEDMIFAAKVIQAGYEIAYAADARVIHSHNLTGTEQFRRNFDLAVSQAEHPEIFAGIRSEGEGVRLVINTAKYLCKKGKWYLVPRLVYVSGCKYTGYLLGKKYEKLPRKFVEFCSLNKTYWRQK